MDVPEVDPRQYVGGTFLAHVRAHTHTQKRESAPTMGWMIEDCYDTVVDRIGHGVLFVIVLWRTVVSVRATNDVVPKKSLSSFFFSNRWCIGGRVGHAYTTRTFGLRTKKAKIRIGNTQHVMTASALTISVTP